MSEKQAPNGLPTYHPTAPESEAEIPSHFLVDGLLSLKQDGRWLFKGGEIDHHGLCSFLLRQLRLTIEGEYWVVNGPQRAFVEVEDTPYLVQAVVIGKDGTPPVLRLNDGSEEPMRPAVIRQNPDNEMLYTEVKCGEAGAPDGRWHRARFSRNAVNQLLPLLAEDAEGAPVLVVGAQEFPIAVA